jgi:hypothetical protein
MSITTLVSIAVALLVGFFILSAFGLQQIAAFVAGLLPAGFAGVLG